MRFWRAYLAAMVLTATAGQAAAEMIDSRSIYMIDGDTAAIGEMRFRLVGFDTPETYRAQCDFEKAWGDAATARARQLIETAGTVDLIVLPGRDRYGRGLARMMIRGRDLGQILIEENLARPYDGGRRQGWCQ